MINKYCYCCAFYLWKRNFAHCIWELIVKNYKWQEEIPICVDI